MRLATLTLNPALDMTVRLDAFRTNTVNRARSMRVDAGGKGVNVASFLAQLGLAVAATGFLGEENSAAFERHFAALGIEDRFVRIAGATRVGVKIVDEGRAETTDINLPGLAPDEAALARLLDEVERLAGACDWFALSGSLPPGVEAGIYADCIARIRARGCRVALDTSGEALRLGVAAGPQVVKPNQGELEELLGRRLDSEGEMLAAARGLLAGGVRLAVVSLGERGALFADGEQALVAAGPAVAAQSTVAAGDALVAGVLAAQARGLSLEEAARFATALAVGKLGFVGARLPEQESIAEIAGRVVVRAVG